MALMGNLESTSFSDVITIFTIGRKTGVLVITVPTVYGILYIADGRLIDAVIVNQANRQIHASGEDALNHIFSWQHGAFRFQNAPDVRARLVQIHLDAQALRSIVSRRSAAPYIPPTAVITLRQETANADTHVKLDLDQWQVMSHLGAPRSFADICAALTTMPASRVAVLVEGLRAAGLLSVALPTHERAPRLSTSVAADLSV